VDRIDLRPGLETRFLDDETVASMFHFPRDLGRRDLDPNRLTTAVLAEYYRDGWKTFH
jgi:predicted membrane-bound spermidine synthase